MREKKPYAIVLPDGKEIQVDLTLDKNWGYNDDLSRLVSKLGYTTPRKDPRDIELTLYPLTIENMQVKKGVPFKKKVRPPLARMTEEEFIAEQEKILSILPEEFHSSIRSEAWDSGHHAGYEEVVSFLNKYTEMVSEPLKVYKKNHNITD